MSLLLQFTEEDNQNKVEHALKREKKSQASELRQNPQKQAQKLFNGSAPDAQHQADAGHYWTKHKSESWKWSPWNKNGTYVTRNTF